uniref:Precorrin-6x reductase n=1 Tax=Paulinella micropora TaxID=1928728 RepID=A0A1L5YD82_9EUKA|nr:Precorrin-6x reductase [Paulinella micropora]
MKGRIWLLSRTSEGPLLAERLLEQGWSLDISVASLTAAKSYPLSSRIEIRIELSQGMKSISLTPSILKARLKEKTFNWIIDATHPFRLNEVDNLSQLCRSLHQPLLRLERPIKTPKNIDLIDSLNSLQDLMKNNENILLIAGLQDLAYIYDNCNTPCFALISPDPYSLQLALSMGFPPGHLACLLPQYRRNTNTHYLEYALCKHWGVTLLILCQSGCPIEQIWCYVGQQIGVRRVFLQNIAHFNERCGFSAKELLEILNKC